MNDDSTQFDEPTTEETARQLFAAPSAEEVEAWKTKFGNIYTLAGDVGVKELTIYCKKPTRQDLRAMMKEISKDSYRAVHNLLVACCIHPTMTDMKGLMEEYPGLIVSLGKEFQEMIGAGTNFTVTKL